MSAQLLLWTICVSLAGAVLCGVGPRRASRIIAPVTAAIVAALAIWATATGFGTVMKQEVGSVPWLNGGASRSFFGVLLDPLSSILLLVATIIGFLTVLYSTEYLSPRNRDHGVPLEVQGRYHFWLLIFVASMVGVAISPNFLQLFIFWELTTLCSWALISFYRNDSSLKAGFKALVMTHIGAGFFLFALILLFVRTGSFEFEALSELSTGERTGVFVCLIIAAWAKAAQVPLHTWLPDAMEAPTPISAYLHAAAMVKAGVYLLARSVVSGWTMPTGLAWLVAAMAVVTILVALSFYFVQDDLKRLLAWSTIAHLGYVLVGVALGALGALEGFRGGVLHIICHGFSKATLFFCVGAVAYVTGSRSISALRGLGRTMPLTATAFFVGVLGVTGVPPFACFWSKFMILKGTLEVPGPAGPILLVVLLCETLVAFAWMLHIAQKVFLGAPSPVALVHSEPPLPMTVTLVVLLIGCLAAPMIGIPFVELIGR